MPAAGLLKYWYLAWFSQPRAERVLYRTLRLARPTSLVELGVTSAVRTKRLLEVMRRFQPDTPLRYAGIDLFEARPSQQPGLSLKQAHRLLGDSGAKVQLVPGDPYSALARAANGLTKTDLLIISADQDRESLARAWFYVPRMLHAGSRVFLEETATGGHTVFRPVSPTEIEQLAKAAHVRPSRKAA